jgi:preprotein translocase subunit Sec61beta
MAKEKKGAGFQSAAGLIRYFDAEDDMALKIPAWAVIFMCCLSVFLVYLAGYLWPV